MIAALTPTVAGTLVPIARYIDWITTTPILMCGALTDLSLTLTQTLALTDTPVLLNRYELGHLAHASTADTLMLVGYAQLGPHASPTPPANHLPCIPPTPPARYINTVLVPHLPPTANYRLQLAKGRISS